MPTGVTTLSMIPPCSCSNKIKGTYYVHPDTDVSTGYKNGHIEVGGLREGLLTLGYARKASRPTLNNNKSGGVQKYRRDSGGSGIRGLHRQPDAAPSFLIPPQSDLSRYHYFSNEAAGQETPFSEEEALNSSENSKLFKRTHGSASRDMVKHDPRSWSTAYNAFDYWCFYRIEFLKYQLKRTVYYQQSGTRQNFIDA